MNSAQTFQELSMFVAGVLVSGEKLLPASNSEKIQAHGLDHTSFRKGPTKYHE